MRLDRDQLRVAEDAHMRPRLLDQLAKRLAAEPADHVVEADQRPARDHRRAESLFHLLLAPPAPITGMACPVAM